MYVPRLQRLTVVLAVAAGLTAGGTATASLAQAGPSDHWTRLSTGKLSNTTVPGLARLGTSLAVLWTQRDPGPTTSYSLEARTLSRNGTPGPTHTALSGWLSLSSDPAPIVSQGRLLVAFGGIQDGDPLNRYSSGALPYATSSDGAAWTVGAGALSQSRKAYAAGTTAAVDDAGTPVVAFAGVFPDRITLHRGLDASFPAAAQDDSTTPTGLYPSGTSLARDPRTGAVYAAWYSDSKAQSGTWVQQVYPMGPWPLTLAPGSQPASGSQPPTARVALVSTPKGVYAAYTLGSPSVTAIRVWKVGTALHHDFTTPNARTVSLAVGVGGRLWLAWSDGGKGLVRAVRSNTAGTAFGAPTTLAFPSSKAGHGAVWQLSIEGSLGPLDVVTDASVPGVAGYSLFHSQLLAPLHVTLSRHSVTSATGGKIVVTVTDAGQPVAGAKVTFDGKVVVINGSGRAAVVVPAGTAKGRKALTVSRQDYAVASLVLTVS